MRAARMVINDFRTTSSVSDMFRQLNWSSLQERRSQAKAIMMYQIVYQLIDIPSTILIPTILSKREYHQLHCVVSQDYKISEI